VMIRWLSCPCCICWRPGVVYATRRDLVADTEFSFWLCEWCKEKPEIWRRAERIVVQRLMPIWN
jgi:hypothetical protein